MLEPGHDCWATCWKIIAGLVAWAMTLKIAVVHLYMAEKKADRKRLEDHQDALDIIRKKRR